MTESSQAREALDALFGTEAFHETPVADVPRELDPSISADAALTWEHEVFRWYRGRDIKGVKRFFKFQRGLSLAQWHALLTSQQLFAVDGPFRSLVQAQNQS